ncbi:MAG: hypothetical protein AAFV93_24620 [Chloroflexota bacterium]
MLTKRLILFTVLLINWMSIAQAQELESCSNRQFVAEFPRVNPLYWCIELPFSADREDAQTFTDLHFASDGRLYATHPFRGQVVRLSDSDGDNLPDTETIVADGLRYPNGIAEHNETLYILGDGVIYTLSGDEIDTLIDDLPSGRGFLARGITIHEDHLYVAIPSPCDFCVGDDLLHGTVIRMALDGTEQTIIARGLRYPSALEIYQDALWVTDSARDGFSADVFYDEVNRIDLNSDTVPHFGFPYCVGYDNLPDLEGDFDCNTATAPIISLRSNSTPISLHHYTDDLFDSMADRLLIVLLGDANSRYIAGHTIISVAITDDGFIYENVAPVDNATNNLPSRWQQADGRDVDPRQTEFVNNQAGGIFPHFPYDVVHSPEGWLYFSVQGKGIYVLRP